MCLVEYPKSVAAGAYDRNVPSAACYVIMCIRSCVLDAQRCDCIVSRRIKRGTVYRQTQDTRIRVAAAAAAAAAGGAAYDRNAPNADFLSHHPRNRSTGSTILRLRTRPAIFRSQIPLPGQLCPPIES